MIHEAPVLRASEPLEDAIRRILDSGLPALPVVGDDDRLVGIFGEREFIGALFPGYLTQLSYAGFVPQALDDALERRQSCRVDPVRAHMNTEHVDVGPDFSDAQVAEIFLHHRVLIIPVVEDGLVRGVITRWDFFKALAESLIRRG